MVQFRDKIGTIESEKGLLELINEIGKEEMGDNFHPYTFQQLCFYANTDCVPTEKRYRTFDIPKKKRGEFRVISTPVLQLKNIQNLIKTILEALYEPKDCVMGFVKKKSVVDNAKKHINKCYVKNIDIKDFFPSVSQDMILKCLIHSPYNIKYKVAFMIARLCCIKKEDNSKVLPQGSPTSPILANMVCEGLDYAIMNLVRQFNLDYTRYADDMTFSGQYNAFKDEGKFIKRLNLIIEQYGFKLNTEKNRTQKHGSRQEVTGIIISSKTNVRRKYVKEIRVMLHNWETIGYDQANKLFSDCYRKKGHKKYVDVPEMRNVLDGKLEYLKMVKGIGDMTYLRLKDRYDRLVSKSDTKVINSWTWNEFEKERGIKLEVKVSPTTNCCFIDLPIDNKTERYFFPHSFDFVNLEHLKIEMIQRGEDKFCRVTEIDKKDSLLLLLNIK